MRYGIVTPIRSKELEIPYYMRDPHYTDERFTRTIGGRTIFLAEGLVTTYQHGIDRVDGAFYNYSDRIEQGYGLDKVREARQEALEQVGNRDTAAFYEAMLQRVYEEPELVLQHIIAGVNQGNGYPYHLYGTVAD